MSFKACLGSGIFSLSLCIIAWVFLVPYYIENDFNPLQDFLNDTFIRVEDFQTTKHLIGSGEETKDVKDFVKGIKSIFPAIIAFVIAVTIVYSLGTILMVIGSCLKMRGLMIPYLFLHPFISINLFFGSVVCNLTFATLHHSGWEFLLNFSLVFVIIVLYKSKDEFKNSYQYLISITLVHLFALFFIPVSNNNLTARLSFFVTCYGPLPLIRCFAEVKKAYGNLLGKTDADMEARIL